MIFAFPRATISKILIARCFLRTGSLVRRDICVDTSRFWISTCNSLRMRMITNRTLVVSLLAKRKSAKIEISARKYVSERSRLLKQTSHPITVAIIIIHQEWDETLLSRYPIYLPHCQKGRWMIIEIWYFNGTLCTLVCIRDRQLRDLSKELLVLLKNPRAEISW